MVVRWCFPDIFQGSNCTGFNHFQMLDEFHDVLSHMYMYIWLFASSFLLIWCIYGFHHHNHHSNYIYIYIPLIVFLGYLTLTWNPLKLFWVLYNDSFRESMLTCHSPISFMLSYMQNPHTTSSLGIDCFLFVSSSGFL